MSQNNLAPKRYIQKFPKLNWEKIAWRHLLQTQKYWNCKLLLDIIVTTITQLNSFLVLYVNPLSVDIWRNYWWNGSNSSITIKRLHKEDQWWRNLSYILVFYVLPRHTNRMTDKGFNLFDKCTSRYAHLFP